MKGHCILSHGFESGPDATKVAALAEAAERLGWTNEIAVLKNTNINECSAIAYDLKK